MQTVRKNMPPPIDTYLSDKVHGGVRPADKAQNARLMELARDLLADMEVDLVKPRSPRL